MNYSSCLVNIYEITCSECNTKFRHAEIENQGLYEARCPNCEELIILDNPETNATIITYVNIDLDTLEVNLKHRQYNYNGMIKVDLEDARNRFNKGVSVYLLYGDNTEALAESITDIEKHYENGGAFGYEA